MTDKEYFDCKFINKYMSFYTYIEFYENRKLYKSKLKEMSVNDVYLYKWYIYANTHMNCKTKDLIWNYLTTSDITEEIMISSKLREMYIKALKNNADFINA